MQELTVVQEDKDTAALQSSALIMRGHAQDVAITDEETLTRANVLGSEVASARRGIENRRKFFVDPLNKHVKSINAFFKVVTGPLDEADKMLRQKILAWRAAEQKRIDDARRAAEAKAREEERKAREKEAAAEAARLAGENRKAAQLERAAVKAQANAEITATTAAALSVAGPVKSMDAGDGVKNKTSLVWSFAVINPTEVPREYLVVDEKKIRAAVQQGIREIPGVVIEQKERLSFSSR